MSKKRRPKKAHRVPASAATVPQPRRTPRVEAAVDVHELKPAWSFAYLDLDWGDTAENGCGWIHLDPGDHRELHARFKAWETMTWGEILLARGSPSHRIPVGRCSKQAQARLRALKLEDIDELVSLRVNSVARVFGVLDQGIFRIMWWDQNHQVCPAKLKHT